MIIKTKAVLEKELEQSIRYLESLKTKKKLVSEVYERNMEKVEENGQPNSEQILMEELLNNESQRLLKSMKTAERKILNWKERLK